MRAKKATLDKSNKRLAGFAIILFPARTFRAIDIRITMNTIGKRHNKPNTKVRSRTFLRLRALGLFIIARIMNGSTKRKLMIAADLRFVRIFFMAFPSVMMKATVGKTTIKPRKMAVPRIIG